LKRLLVLGLVVCVSGFLAGCQGGGSSELSPDQDKALRTNMSRQLTPEEIAKLGGSQPAGGQGGSAPAEMPAGKGPR